MVGYARHRSDRLGRRTLESMARKDLIELLTVSNHEYFNSRGQQFHGYSGWVNETNQDLTDKSVEEICDTITKHIRPTTGRHVSRLIVPLLDGLSYRVGFTERIMLSRRRSIYNPAPFWFYRLGCMVKLMPIIGLRRAGYRTTAKGLDVLNTLAIGDPMLEKWMQIHRPRDPAKLFAKLDYDKTQDRLRIITNALMGRDIMYPLDNEYGIKIQGVAAEDFLAAKRSRASNVTACQNNLVQQATKLPWAHLLRLTP